MKSTIYVVTLVATLVFVFGQGGQAQTPAPGRVRCSPMASVSAMTIDSIVVRFKLPSKGTPVEASVFVWALDPGKARFDPKFHDRIGTCPEAPEKGIINWIAKVDEKGEAQIAFVSGLTGLKYRFVYDGKPWTGDLTGKQQSVTLP